MGDPAASDASARAWHTKAGRRLAAALTKARRRPSARTERVLLVVSLVAFVGAAAVAAGRFPAAPADIRWGLLAIAGLVGMPANVVLNAVEFQVIGRFVDQRVAMGRAVKVTIVGSAANLLPLPGSTLVRVQALAAEKARYRDAFVASAAVGVMAVGANLALAGVAQAFRARLPAVVLLLAGAVLVTGAAIAAIVAVFPRSQAVRPASAAFTVEVIYASVSAVRLWLILHGLGLDVGLPEVFVLTATGALATAVGFFPAGLGIREAMIGILSPVVGIPLAAGLAGAVVERLLWFAVLAIASGGLLVRDRHALSRPRLAGDASSTDPSGS